jgi:triosephosphate isomerase (TIM)
VTARGRTPLVCGNWKLHHGIAASEALARDVVAAVSSTDSGVEVVIAPAFTALASVAKVLAGTRVALSAQDVFWEERGAFTGEVSPEMLVDAGCTFSIIGNSERRALFGETDLGVKKKRVALLARRAIPIVLAEIDAAFEGSDAIALARCAVAYEPVWAIGTGKVARPEDAQEIHAAIRARLAKTVGASAAASLPILYGGSVKPDNAADLMAEPDIDGALVGGASLDAKGFAAIVRAATRP